ncbi:MAG: alpha/beta hydrolase, partial [Bacteroidia bacterium]|nr:alpha/beta hydrolase [Bacteroidia bacterium]
MKFRFTALLLFSLFFQLLTAQKTELIEYKVIDTTKLTVKVFYPENFESTAKFPAIVFYFGGGWITRAISQFETHSKYFAQRGMVCFIVDYRVTKTDKTTPFESLMDAKSAMRFIKANAKRFHLDTTKMVASGGSAGGHLAA